LYYKLTKSVLKIYGQGQRQEENEGEEEPSNLAHDGKKLHYLRYNTGPHILSEKYTHGLQWRN
jgi:hypothetical protein